MQGSKLLDEFLTPIIGKEISVLGYDKTREIGILQGFDRYSVWIDDRKNSTHKFMDLKAVDSIYEEYKITLEDTRQPIEETL